MTITKLILQLAFCALSLCYGIAQSVTAYQIAESDSPNTLELRMKFDFSAMGTVIVDNATINIYVSSGTAAPSIGTLDNGTWMIHPVINSTSIVTECAAVSFSGLDVYQISSTAPIIINGVSSNAYTPILELVLPAGTNLAAVPLWNPNATDAISTCLKACGMNNTADLVLDGSTIINTGWQDIIPNPPCVNDLVVMNNPIVGIYQADNSIVTSNMVLVNGETRFDAGNFIELNADFEVLVGQTFIAQIKSCD